MTVMFFYVDGRGEVLLPFMKLSTYRCLMEFKKIGYQLNRAILDKGYSGNNLAADSGCTPGQISVWRKGGGITQENLAKLCKPLGYTVEEFLALKK